MKKEKSLSTLNKFKQIIATSPVLNFNLVERDRWVKLQASSLKSKSKVLDVGAGSSPYRDYFSHCEYKTQDFCQLNPEQLRFRQGYSPIDYVSEAHQIPVANASFDVVLCTEVFEHVPNPIEVLHEISRILKSDGVLILTAPLGSGLHQHPYHFYGGYTPFWYEKFLNEANFKNISITPNKNFFKFFGQECQRFISYSYPWKIKTNIIFKLLWLPVWIILIPILCFLVPIFCHFIDDWDYENNFTIGYHVYAEKR